MIEFIVNAFKDLLQFIGTAWDFLIHLFQELVYMIGLLGRVIVNLPAYFGWLPAAVSTLIVTAISIVVVLRILGRE